MQKKRMLLVLGALLALCLPVISAYAATDKIQIDTTLLRYKVTVNDTIDRVKDQVTSSLEARNYAIINLLNVQEGLNARGIKAEPLVLIEFCNLVKAYSITRNVNEFELFAPCRIALFGHGGKTTIMVLRPSQVAALLPSKNLSPEGRAALATFDKDLHEIFLELASGGF